MALGVLLLASSASARADDLSGANRILCTAVQATICTLEDGCEMGAPWDYNVPQFIEVDLEKLRLGTTPASNENRSTPIRNVQREDGKIYLQGVEEGRAFSFVIEESTGFASIAVAREKVTVSVFGACTPVESAGR
jgi:hypothetical protein